MTPLLRRLLFRLGWAALTLAGLAFVVLVLVKTIPADPVGIIAGPHADAETKQRLREQLGLDDPLWQQYLRYLARAVRGDLSRSYVTQENVGAAILARFPATLVLALAGVSLWLALGVPAGVLTARYRDTAFDRVVFALAVLSLALPTFWLGRLLQYQFAYRDGWFPVAGLTTWRHLVLPAITLGLVGAGFYARLMHASMLEVLAQDYIRAARARGLSETTVLFKHALRNALLPVLSVLGTDVAALLGGVVFTESIFAIPGLGRLGVEAVLNLDAPMMLGVVLFSGLIVVLCNLAVDLLYAVIDPRVRSGV
jgi:peptide/nickel transport system permease protein